MIQEKRSAEKQQEKILKGLTKWPGVDYVTCSESIKGLRCAGLPTWIGPK